MLQLKPSLRQLLLYHEALTVLQLFRTRSVQRLRYMQQVPLGKDHQSVTDTRQAIE
jgi:hypothetical protein